MLIRRPFVVSMAAFRNPGSFTTMRGAATSETGQAQVTPAPLPKLAPNSPAKTRVLWLRNNLRLDDNLAFVEASRAAVSRGETLLPVYCLDVERNVLQTTKFDSPKCSARRASFLLESLTDMDARLGELGSRLLVSPLSPAATFQALDLQCISAVHVMAEVATEEIKDERAVAAALKSCGSAAPELVRTWDGTLYHRDDLPRGCDPASMPLTFTPWKNKVEGSGPPRAPVGAPASLPPLPKLQKPEAEPQGSLCLSTFRTDDPTVLAPFQTPDLKALGYSAEEAQAAAVNDPRTTLAYKGGETAAKARMQGWAFDRDCLKTYFDTRNGLIGPDYSTKLAPWLALGCISPRRVYSEIKRYEASPNGVANKSTYWVIFELLWRDFFKFMGAKVGTKLFERTGPMPPSNMPAWRDPRYDPHAMTALQAWRDGNTGVPFVDANMRELKATGFMSNRGRQNVASFLVHDLQLDWRCGADHFEAMLLDYDVCSNWGNWVAAAGLTGGRVNRFNILKQSRDYDPDAAYVHLWCPELAEVPAPTAFEPWKLSKAAQPEGSAVLRYPARIPCPGSAESYFSQGGKGKGGKGGGGKGGGNQAGKRDGNNKAKAVDRPGRGKRGGRVQSSYMEDYD